MRYLLDELHTYEEDYSNALRPIPLDANKSHAGVARLAAPLSTEEARRLFEDQAANNRDAIHSAYLMAMSQCVILPPTPATGTGFTSTPDLPFNPGLPPPSHNAQAPAMNLPPTTIFGSATFADSNLTRDRRGTLVAPTSEFGSMNDTTSVRNPNPRPAPVNPGRIIPKITAKGAAAWKMVIRDWQFADPSRSLEVALKDWPKHWYSGDRSIGQQIGVQYNQRRTIATEFLEKYSPHLSSVIRELTFSLLRIQVQR